MSSYPHPAHPIDSNEIRIVVWFAIFTAINYHNFVDKFKLESKWNSRNKVGDKTK